MRAIAWRLRRDRPSCARRQGRVDLRTQVRERPSVWLGEPLLLDSGWERADDAQDEETK